MAKGVKISYISGSKTPIHQPYYIAGDDETQALLDGIVVADQLSFYKLNVAKAQLTDLINQYNYGTIPAGWDVATYSEALSIIDDINTELTYLGQRQNAIKSNPDIQTQTGVDPNFSEYVGVGVIPVIIIVVAIIVAGAVVYELIEWLEDLTIDSDTTVQQTEILSKAAMSLTPAEQKAYWDDIQRQVDKAYKAGYAQGNDGSLFGDITKFAPYLLGGVALYFLWPMLSEQRSNYKSKKSISGVGCNICAIQKRKKALLKKRRA